LYLIRQSMSRGELLGCNPMERFFRKSEDQMDSSTSYVSFSDAVHVITDYIVGYYSALRPHE
ncbi:IS3 family transposase, partial [Escherichia coli]|nr:IS3 family transposase [Escherichia coli]